jgi:hypothetical protein
MIDKDCPCTRDCAERNATCHSTCEGYLKYRAQKDAECEARAAYSKLDGCSTAGEKGAKRKAMMDRKRGRRKQR